MYMYQQQNSFIAAVPATLNWIAYRAIGHDSAKFPMPNSFKKYYWFEANSKKKRRKRNTK